MATLTLADLPDDLIDRLASRAARNNRSVEAEHRAILMAAVASDDGGYWSRAAELRASARGRFATDSTELIRRDRDRDDPALPPQTVDKALATRGSLPADDLSELEAEIGRLRRS